jgi:hypothetical protein
LQSGWGTPIQARKNQSDQLQSTSVTGTPPKKSVVTTSQHEHLLNSTNCNYHTMMVAMKKQAFCSFQAIFSTHPLHSDIRKGNKFYKIKVVIPEN